MKRHRMLAIIAVLVAAIALAGCGEKAAKQKDITIVFGEAGWDSIKFHDAVAMYIIQNAFGYKTEEVSGATAITYSALLKGDVDVYMEIWTDNLASYKDDVSSGKIKEVGVNFDDNAQGLYVPRFVIEGDAERGIAPMAPDLEYVADLARYSHVFKDDETPGKGRMYGAIPGWEVDNIVFAKYQHYGLESNFVYFRAGSDAALAAAFAAAYGKGQAIVGYYWEPTWLTGKYDLVLLKDEPYDASVYRSGECEFPAVPVTICVSAQMEEKAPEVVRFLERYRTSSAMTSAALAYIEENNAFYMDAAKWFLKEYEEVWTAWLDDKEVKAVKATL